MKIFIYLNCFFINVIYVCGQGDHNHQSLSAIHIDAPGQHGNEHNNQPTLHLPPGANIDDARAAGVIHDITNTNSKDISINNQQPKSLPGSNFRKTVKTNSVVNLSRKQRKQLSDLTDVSGFQRSEFGILDNRRVLLTKGKKKRGGRRRGRRRGRNKKRRTTTSTTSTSTTTATTTTTTTTTPTTTTTTSATTTTKTTTIPTPKKSGGNSGLTIIKSSRPNPFSAFGNALRSAFNIQGSGNRGLLGSFMGPSLIQQSSGPLRMQPFGRPFFGGLFGGKR